MTITIPPGEYKIGATIPFVSLFEKNFIFDGTFIASGGWGDDIKTLLIYNSFDNSNVLYNSGQVHQDSFTIQITKDGYYNLIFDNSSSIISSKTVSFSFKVTYDKDIILPQVYAIYQALQSDYSITYVNSPISFPQMNSQRVRYPNDALTLGEANCIDGTVLFASALENIGIEPFIVLIPRHAFVGWKRWTDSKYAEFLETTMIGTASFQDAYNEGNKKYNNEFVSGRDFTIDVEYCRKYGITPNMKPISTKVAL